MSFLPWLVGGYLAYNFLQKEEDETQFTETSPGGATTPKPGNPRIQITGINRVFNDVKWKIIFPDGQSEKMKIDIKKDEDISRKFGDWWVQAEKLVESETDPKTGETMMVPYGVQITLYNAQKKPIQSKRVIMKTKQVIDIL